MRKTIALIPAALAGLMLLVLLLYGAVMSFALSPAAYPQEPPYDAMAVELTEYLAGRQPELSTGLFTERERMHMVDVLDIFNWARQLAWFCLAGSVLCVLAALAAGGLAPLGRGLLIGMGAAVVFALVIVVWAAIDFNGWFVTMHELVFTNDLWLLDPAESMLIRMLPLDFFIGACKTIALRFGLGVAVLLASAIGCIRFGRKHKEKT